MTNLRRGVFGVLAAGAACAAVSIPSAPADPTPTPAPAPSNCTTAGLASTISSVSVSLSTYFAAHPDANQALIDATKQSAFSAIGAFNDYFSSHPDQADEIRRSSSRWWTSRISAACRSSRPKPSW